MWAEDGECGGWLGTFGRSPRSGSRFPSSTFRNGKGKRDEGYSCPIHPRPPQPLPARPPPARGGREEGRERSPGPGAATRVPPAPAPPLGGTTAGTV